MISNIPDLISFLLHYHRHLGVPPGLDSSLIPAGLPPGLALLYEKLGGWIELRDKWGRGPFSTQDTLIRPSDIVSEGRWVNFAVENQCVWTAYCEIGKEDPPVFTDAPDVLESDGPRTGDPYFEEEFGEDLVLTCNSLNQFLINLCLQEAMFGVPLVYCAKGRFSESLFLSPLETLANSSPVLGIPTSRTLYFIPEVEALVMTDGTRLDPYIGSYIPTITRVLANPDAWVKLS